MRVRALAVHALRGGGGMPRKSLSSSLRMVGGSPLATSAKVFAGFNAAGLGISLASDTHVHLDLIGTGAFAFAAAATRGAGPTRGASTGMVVAWATRLAGFLFYRALTGGRDARLEDTLSTAGGCISFWVVSWAWGWLTLLPHALGATSAAATSAAARAARRAGAAAFAVGLATEVVADVQKFAFKRAHPGRFCDVGVWAASQHPNWFGNWLLWAGVFIFNAPGMAPRRLALAALSPLSLGCLFAAQATGHLTPAVDLAQKRYGADPAFAAYVAATPLVVPDARKLGAALLGAVAGRA